MRYFTATDRLWGPQNSYTLPTSVLPRGVQWPGGVSDHPPSYLPPRLRISGAQRLLLLCVLKMCPAMTLNLLRTESLQMVKYKGLGKTAREYFKAESYNLQLVRNTTIHFRIAYGLQWIRKWNTYFPSLVGGQSQQIMNRSCDTIPWHYAVWLYY